MNIVIVASTTDCETIEGICLSDDTGIIYEPGTVVPTPPELADTGADPTGVLLVAAILLGVGVTIILAMFARFSVRARSNA